MLSNVLVPVDGSALAERAPACHGIQETGVSLIGAFSGTRV
jgi:hypothetical protein